jgi:hypothetical protein
MLFFETPRSSFKLSYEIPCVDCFLDETAGFNGGRNFLFGGSSSLCAWPTVPRAAGVWYFALLFVRGSYVRPLAPFSVCASVPPRRSTCRCANASGLDHLSLAWAVCVNPSKAAWP